MFKVFWRAVSSENPARIAATGGKGKVKTDVGDGRE
jgi:hypothetical protein